MPVSPSARSSAPSEARGVEKCLCESPDELGPVSDKAGEPAGEGPSLAARSLAARSLAARSLAARSLAARSLATRSPGASIRFVAGIAVVAAFYVLCFRYAEIDARRLWAG